MQVLSTEEVSLLEARFLSVACHVGYADSVLEQSARGAIQRPIMDMYSSRLFRLHSHAGHDAMIPGAGRSDTSLPRCIEPPVTYPCVYKTV